MSADFHKALRRFSPWLALVAIYAVLGSVGRLMLWFHFGLEADVGAGQLPYILTAGLVNDLVESLYLFAPFALYIALVPDRWFRTTANRVILYGGTIVTIAGLLYLVAAEYFFFEEFDARFNIVAFDYLAYPTEVFVDIWDAYPVVKVLLVAATIGAIGTYLLRGSVGRGTTGTVRLRERLVFFVPYAFVLALAVAFYPTSALSWSANRVENELVQNGHSSFFRAARTSDIDYESYYSSADMRGNLALLDKQLAVDGVGMTRLAEGRIDRRHDARADGLGRLNVVVIASESFGAEFSRLHGSERDWTPNFDAYARKGLWFANTYASGTRTVRGLEAITASFPPIPTVSILRRPGNQKIATWGSVMNRLGYHSSFLYGGYGYFDDMNSFYAGNGFEVLDRTDITKVRFANIWGVSDEDLFDRAIEHFGQQYAKGQPFFSIVMTTSNHKPFTFRPGLEKFGIPEEGRRSRGRREVRRLRARLFPAAGRAAALVRRHHFRRRGRPRCARLRQGRDPAQDVRNPADDLRAEVATAAPDRYAHDADRHRPDGARDARLALRGAVLRHRRAACIARAPRRALQPQSRRRDLP